MTTEEFVQNVNQEIFEDAYNYYFEKLSTPIVGVDEYWIDSKTLYQRLRNKENSCRLSPN